MIIQHLLSKRALKEYIKAIDVDSLNLIRLRKINLEDDDSLTLILKMSKVLGYLSITSSDARRKKHLLLFRSFHYLSKYDFECDEFATGFWSKDNPDYYDKVTSFNNKLNEYRKSRAAYLKFLAEISGILEIHDRLKKRMRPFAKNKIKAVDGREYNEEFWDYVYTMDATKDFEGRIKNDKDVQWVKWAIESREKAIEKLNNLHESLSDGNLISLWLDNKINLLSLSSLRRLSNIIQKEYKSEFSAEIEEKARNRKRENDRKRYIPKQSHTKQEKIELILKSKKDGLSQKATIEKLKFSKSTVENYWNYDDTLKNSPN